MVASTRICAIIVLIAWMLALTIRAKAQDVIRKGNTFIEVSSDSSAKRGEYKKTDILFTDRNGRTDTVYISSTGKAFIIKTSKKTGKRYRRYLPKVTEELNNVSNKTKTSRP